jgi:hypothetical protein
MLVISLKLESMKANKDLSENYYSPKNSLNI